MSLWTRFRRVEAWWRQRVPSMHFLTSVQVPWNVDTDTWLQTEVTCACGQHGCPELRVGLVVPERFSSSDDWQQQAQQFYREWPDHA
jgi:hypothetical protein